MSLRDGKKKMSKSEESDYSRLNLTDSPDDIINKIKKAKTDPLPLPSLDSLDKNNLFKEKIILERPETVNLLNIFSAKGEGNTSMRDIASGAGVSLGTVHHYFGSKHHN